MLETFGRECLTRASDVSSLTSFGEKMSIMNRHFCAACGITTSFVDERCTECIRREEQEEDKAWNDQCTFEKLKDLHQRIKRLEQQNARQTSS